MLAQGLDGQDGLILGVAGGPEQHEQRDDAEQLGRLEPGPLGPLGVRGVQGLEDGQEDGQRETVERNLFLIGHGAELFQFLPVKFLAAAEALHVRMHEVHHEAHTGDDKQGNGHHAQGPVDEVDIVLSRP